VWPHQLDYREEALQAREQALQEGLLQMQSSAKALQYREGQLLDGIKLIETQQSRLERIDSDMLEKKLLISAAQRQSLNFQAQQSKEKALHWSMESHNPPPLKEWTSDYGVASSVNHNSGNNGPVRNHLPPKTPPYTASNSNSYLNMSNPIPFHLDQDAQTPPPEQQSSWTEKFHLALQQTGGSRHMQRQAMLKDPAVSELMAAQDTLRATRASLDETSERQLQRRRFLDKEEKFLKTIEKQRRTTEYY
jgi:hypothetical protein